MTPRTNSIQLPPRPAGIQNATARYLGLHRWLGRVLMLYLLTIFVSGTLLVFGAEIESLLSPQMQRDPTVAATQGQATPAGFGALLNAAQEAYPAAKPLILRTPKSDWFAAEVEMREKGADFIVWLDPNTAKVQGKTAVLGFREVLRRFHVSLFIDARPMLMLTTSVSLLLITQLVLGLAAYRRFWRGLFRVSGLRHQGRMRWGTWHRAAGLWSLPVLTVICLTGVLYFSETLGFTPPLPAAAKSALRDTALPAGFDGAALDQATMTAMSELPGLAIREIYFPVTKTESLAVRGDLDAHLVRPRANAVNVDPVTFAPLGVHRGEDLGFDRRLVEAADPLHFGIWGGLATQVIWVFSGLLASLLAASGIKITSWRLSTSLGQPVSGSPRLSAAVGAIFKPARFALAALFAICVVGAVRLLT